MFLKEFEKRGYLYQCTNIEKLTEITSREKIVGYIGFDCTAKSLHVGSLMQIMILRLMQKHGHKPIVIIGDGTTRIGDPTGKSQERKILSLEEIEENIVGIKKSLSKFLKFADDSKTNAPSGVSETASSTEPDSSDAIMVRNSSWLDSLNYIDFLRDYGRHMSVNRMLTMDSAKSRLENNQNLSFLEFNYMLLQGYDFCHLNKHYNCVLQMGGSDQWGNIVMGVEAARKILDKEIFGLTTPLLTTASGAKMGKTAAGAVWLNEEMLSAYDYFQYWRNCDDLDVVKFAKMFADFNDDAMNEFAAVAGKDINAAKKQLAHRLTYLCHGSQKADEAKEAAQKVFEAGGVDSSLPSIYVSEKELTAGILITDLLFMCKLVASKSEAKKLIRAKGARINDQQVQDEGLLVRIDSMLTSCEAGKYIKLSSGKKNHVLVKLDHEGASL